MPSPANTVRLLLVCGFLALLLAGLSIADMFLPRPYDGVVLASDSPGALRVQKVVESSGAARAGIRAGDEIVGIDRSALTSLVRVDFTGRDRSALRRAAELLNLHEIGDVVPYLVRRDGRVVEVSVELGRRRIGGTSYLYATMLGFAFSFVGLFVLLRQPRQRASWVFFVLCSLFMLFLVCRLRPASYSWVDSLVLTTGTAALLFLPAAFLHFFLVFPRPFTWMRGETERPFGLSAAGWRTLLTALYLLPLAVHFAAVLLASRRGGGLTLISGSPAVNWWVLTAYVVVGIVVLAIQARRLAEPRQRRGAALVLLGALFGLVPFLVLAVAFPSFLNTEEFVYYGVWPLALVPLTFAYAIVRFQLLDIRVIVRKSLLYTATSALVTAFYALGIAFFNTLFRSTRLATSGYFPIVLAIAIVVLFEPLRRRIQGPIDRFFFAERTRLQRAMVEMGEAFGAQVDLAAVVRDLVQRLPAVLNVEFAALYLRRGEVLERVAGPEVLPRQLPHVQALHEQLRRHGGLAHIDQLPRVEPLEQVDRPLRAAGVEVVGDLASRRRSVGVVVLSGKVGQMSYESEELRLLGGLLQQAGVALDTSLLVEERTRQAELERELEIAASIQRSLLPQALEPAPGWRIAAVCRPARHVGGDFFVELPGITADGRALVYGDVSGKSVPGALMMMAAHEVLYSLAMANRDPAHLLDLANQRLYKLGKRSFVALGYFAFAPDSEVLQYTLAGQPQPLKRRRGGEVVELPLPAHRLPLGALLNGARYQLLDTPLAKGDLVLGYSDGVIDAMSPDGEPFGSERLVAALAGAPEDPHDVIEHVLEALDDYTQGIAPYDDVTLVALSRHLQDAA